MPIYAYRCGGCDYLFELRQGFDADPEQPCPRCKSAARRRFHAPSVIYKGSGFYTTDYARSGSSSSSGDGSSSSSSASTSSPSSSSSDSSKSEKSDKSDKPSDSK